MNKIKGRQRRVGRSDRRRCSHFSLNFHVPLSNVRTGKYSEKGAFLLCKTSNPGSNDLLALNLASGETLFEQIAKLAGQWSDTYGSELGLVVGATDVGALERARKAGGSKVWILAPGVGEQGGDLAAATKAGMNESGNNMLIPVSRGISKAVDRTLAAKELCDKINQVRDAIKAEASSTLETKGQHDEGIQPYQTEFLEFSLKEGVLKFGSFTLKSGRTSPYFFNAGLFATGGSLHKLGKSYASAIMSSTEL